jgi:protein phosphatase
MTAAGGFERKGGHVGLFSWWEKIWGPRGPEGEGSPPTEPTVEMDPVPALRLASGKHELQVGVVTTTGNVREHNEDNYYVPGRTGGPRSSAFPSTGSFETFGRPERNTEEFIPGAAQIDNPPDVPTVPASDNGQAPKGPDDLFIVADGMGGQLAGEKASEMAVEIIPGELLRRLAPEDDEKETKRSIRESVAEANKEILAQSHLVTEYANMGTTVVLLLFRGDRAYVTGIGDSRAYRLREGKIERLTEDHSLADALGKAGTIRPEEVENHKFRHVLYLYLGSKDAREGPEDIRAVDVRAGDRFLLASDGLTGVVRDEMIVEIMRSCEDPQRAAQVLVNRAIEYRSKDNITCVVIHVVT